MKQASETKHKIAKKVLKAVGITSLTAGLSALIVSICAINKLIEIPEAWSQSFTEQMQQMITYITWRVI